MSKYLAEKVRLKCPNIQLDNVEYSTKINLNCAIHGMYIKTVNQILYKNSNCPECTRLAKNKKLSDIGKTKVGELNNFYGHTHTHETRQKLSKPLSDERKKKISEIVKSNKCQSKIKQTKLNKYGSVNYVNATKMKQTKTTILQQYMDQHDCCLVTDLVCQYGDSWRQAGIVDIIIYKAHAFVKNEDIDKIIKYVNSITKHAGMSHKEKELVDFIKSFYSGVILENKRKIIYPQELDIFLPDINVAIEFNGNYWHSTERGCSKDYHLRKSILCKEKGIRLIHIYEFEDLDIQKKLLKSFLLGHDKYPVNDYNKNNFLDKIPKLYKNNTNKGTVYSIGPVIKEVNYI